VIVSHAQNFEDVILWRALKHVKNGLYIDIGAQDPDTDSVSRIFYDAGWRGVHVEPSPYYAEKIRQARPDERVWEVAIGVDDPELVFYEIPETGMSTVLREVADHHREHGLDYVERRVRGIPLSTLFADVGERDVHWMKIDVEGFEADVIASWRPAETRPWVVVVESVEPGSQVPSHEVWEPELLSLGYQCVYFDGLNRYYLSDEHRELAGQFGVPPNIFDRFRVSEKSPYADNSHLQRQVAEKVALVAKLDDTLRSHVAELQAANAEIARLHHAVKDRDDNVKKLMAALSEREQKLAAGYEKVTHLQRQVAELQAAKDENDNLNELRAALSERDQRLAAGNEEITRLHDVIATMQSSRSWWLTFPLRKLNEWRANPVLHAKIVAKRLLRTPVHTVVDCARPIVRRNPWAKRLAREALVRVPWLHARVGRLLAAKSLRPTAGGPAIQLRIRDMPQPSTTFANHPASTPLPAGERVIYFFVDHTVWCQTNTGVQRTTRGFGAALSHAGEKVQYVSWDPSTEQCVFLSSEQREQLALWNGQPFSEHERAFYRPAAEGFVPIPGHPAGECNWLIVPEVTYITTHVEAVTLPLIGWARKVGLKTAFVFYDAIPLRRAELSRYADAHAKYMREIMLSDLVLPISEWAAEDLVAFWKVSEQANVRTMPRIEPVGLGADWAKKREREGHPADTMILSVGTIDERKNQLALAKAFFAFSQARPNNSWKLVLVGNIDHRVSAGLQEFCKRSGGRIEHRGNISDEELNTLFEQCAFTVFPSVEEGFGLPIIESLSYGKPCVCANFGSMGALAQGGGCLAIDTRDHSQIEHAIETLTEDAGRLAVLTEEARVRKISTWADYAGEVQSIIDGFSDPNSRIDRILFWVDSTITFNNNSGIQRVARQLARSLIGNGANVVPVKWDQTSGKLVRPTAAELAHFSRWNGPEPSAWSHDAVDAASFDNSWFLMSELPLNQPPAERAKIATFCRMRGIRMAGVFFDAIPWKMRDVYPKPFSVAHFDYMVELYEYDRILPISNHCRNDLLEFWADYRQDCHLADDKTLTASLPCEFPETERVATVKQEHGDTINILCVGTIEPRKNHVRMLEAYTLANKRMDGKLRLTIVGSDHTFDMTLVNQVTETVASDPTIVWERKADDVLLDRLYRASDFTFYASYEEGFGLPIVESLWHARPCICANFGAMREVALDRACLAVDVLDVNAMAEAIVKLASDANLRERLAQSAVEARFKSWKEYGNEILGRLAEATPEKSAEKLAEVSWTERASAMSLKARPKLSLCISTYNRAEWLKASLANWARQCPEPVEGVEIFVCDNASTDETREVVELYLSRPDFTYRCNPRNVGMLGNLRETAHHANGEYIWILGDDDLLVPGALERVLKALRDNPGVALVYLNYAFTHIEDARTISSMDDFFRSATPIVPAEEDRMGPIKDFCARNENFFTAIYTLVFRRDHAIHAYSQNTSGRPFSTMLTCIPTTYHVLHRMMDEPGIWIGEPQIVVNMNVSWMKYAPLWILERIPEVYSLAEMKGAAQEDVDRWRNHTLPSVANYSDVIYQDDPLGNAEYFNPARLIRRFKHVRDFPKYEAILRKLYARADARDRRDRNAATAGLDVIFPQATN
jgi:FkbM family methyltransferase